MKWTISKDSLVRTNVYSNDTNKIFIFQNGHRISKNKSDKINKHFTIVFKIEIIWNTAIRTEDHSFAWRSFFPSFLLFISFILFVKCFGMWCFSFRIVHFPRDSAHGLFIHLNESFTNFNDNCIWLFVPIFRSYSKRPINRIFNWINFHSIANSNGIMNGMQNRRTDKRVSLILFICVVVVCFGINFATRFRTLCLW